MIMSSYSLFVSVVISIIRFKKIGPVFYPILSLLYLGATNELITEILLRNGYYNAINSNIFTLIEAMLILWYFKRSAIFSHINQFYPFLISLFVVTWVIDNFWIGKFGFYFNSYFNIVAGFPIVLISLQWCVHLN
jgi:hypothetical protein